MWRHRWHAMAQRGGNGGGEEALGVDGRGRGRNRGLRKAGGCGVVHTSGCGGTSRQLLWRWSPVWRHRWHAMAQRGSDGSGEGAQEDDESGRAGWRSSVESVVELIEER